MGPVDRIFELADKKFKYRRDFAAALGVYPSVVSLWSSGKSTSFTDRIPQIAEVLETTTDYLLRGEKKEPATISSDELDPDVIQLLKQIKRQGKMDEVKRYLRFQATPEEKQ